MTNGEAVSIRPQKILMSPMKGFNWDSPILVSYHDPKDYTLEPKEFGDQKTEVIAGQLFLEI
ncbi:MAG: hypothetical protein CM15mP121_3040 [Bacteroidota bacterium]|nr:MAG: hypothetical protein CM15mP121_3040 [Bacteroidota bacterium]